MQHFRIIDLSNDNIAICEPSRIHDLPESLGNLKHLEVLDVFGCQDLKQFPTSFTQLSNLRNLDIRHSGITELHLTEEQWGGLESLRMQGMLPDLTLCANLKAFAWRPHAGFRECPMAKYAA
jgi:Leucine-rich repeat (LRR) protein